MTLGPLSEIFFANRGNISDKWEQYLAIYEAELSPWHGREVSLLEIGVQNGGSMQVWAKYFAPESRLMGLDIDERVSSLVVPANVSVQVADATDSEALSLVVDGSSPFDIIIDDGSHFSGDIIQSFCVLFPHLAEGGRYIVEDLHCAYWRRFGGGLQAASSAVEFLKRLVDVLHLDYLEAGDHVGRELDGALFEGLKTGLARVSFYDSIAVVERLPMKKEAPYRRLLAGDDGFVVDPIEILALEPHAPLRFTEPLARAIESRLHSEFADIRTEANRLSSELELERRNLAAVEADRIRLSADLDLERANLAAVDADRLRLDDRLAEQRDSARRVLSVAGERMLRHAREVEAAHLVTLRSAQAEVDALRRELGDTQGRCNGAEHRAADLSEAVTSLRHQVDAIERSATYRAMEPVRRAIRGVRRRVRGLPGSGSPEVASGDQLHSAEVDTYRKWREEFGNVLPADRRLIDEHLADGSIPAAVLLVRVERADLTRLDDMVRSLLAQRTKNWRAWFFAADENDSSVTGSIGGLSARDQRLQAARPQIDSSTPSTDDLCGAVVVTTGSTLLREHALYLFCEAVSRGKKLVYGDAEVADAHGLGVTPDFRPGFSPLHQELHGYIGSTFALDNSDGSSAETLRAFLRNEATAAGVIAATEGLSRHSVERVPFIVQQDVLSTGTAPADSKPTFGPTVPVTIIIPTRDRLELLKPCIESLLERTDYPDDQLEILVVDNGSIEPETLNYLRRAKDTHGLVVLRDDGDFNFARLNNRAAEVATGDVLVLLNNDTTVLDPKWLRMLVGYVCTPDVGVVGAKLLYPDGAVQHGGVVLGIQGVAGHVNHMLEEDDVDYRPIANLTHEVTAVTGACMAIRREVFEELGGLDERLVVAFNDVDLCCAAIAAGYRNIYVGSALLIHHESKSRGFDTTPERQELFQQEAILARSKNPSLYREDPYYNPNLSLLRPYDLAEPPRSVRPWSVAARRRGSRRSVLMLSSTHQRGHGVAVVLDQQAHHLASLGHRVIVGGPASGNDFEYEGCERIFLQDPLEAAQCANESRVDVVVMHTPPFYGVARWLGAETLTVAYDYGEPSPEMFADSAGRRAINADKLFSMSIADQRFAISEAVSAESGIADMAVLPLGNEHLAIWGPDMAATRQAVRDRHGWGAKLVVLNVCRFHAAERQYKGVDAYVVLMQLLRAAHPELGAEVVFVLAGKGDAVDVQQMTDAGLHVAANVPDGELIDLYCAADAYASFSRWEGYNLGIGQALAMGLPTIASDIPAHRAFGIATTDDVAEQVAFIQRLVDAKPTLNADRVSRIWPWSVPLEQLTDIVSSDRSM
jgi:GT2 family glycosyltransferase/glycosyltransferase involved in cell wall biosynthesis